MPAFQFGENLRMPRTSIWPPPNIVAGKTIRAFPSTGAALFQLEFDEFDEGRTGVLHRPGLPGVLPDEIAYVRSHAAIGRSGHHFGQYAAVDVDPESRCRLRDLPGCLPRFHNDAPSSYARVIHDL